MTDTRVLINEAQRILAECHRDGEHSGDIAVIHAIVLGVICSLSQKPQESLESLFDISRDFLNMTQERK
jgi:hypothetical protein